MNYEINDKVIPTNGEFKGILCIIVETCCLRQPRLVFLRPFKSGNKNFDKYGLFYACEDIILSEEKI